MPRCKALVRGGSRQCKRKALKGSMFCSQHGGVVASQSRNNRSRISSHSVLSRSASVRSLSNNNKGVLSSSLPPQSSRRRLNPAFTKIGTSNPLVQHFIADKVGDFSRTANVGVAANIATMPMLYGGGPGLAAKVVTSLGATIVIGGYLNTVDQYRDLAQFAATGKIHGHSVFGESHH